MRITNHVLLYNYNSLATFRLKKYETEASINRALQFLVVGQKTPSAKDCRNTYMIINSKGN